MKSKMRSVWLCFMIASFGCTDSNVTPSLPYYADPSFTPVWSPPSDTLDKFHAIPQFTLTDQQGEPFDSVRLTGKPYVARFFFTKCPGICPKMTKNLKGLQASYPNEARSFNIVNFSVTPDIDTPEVLREFAATNGVDQSNWVLLTGDRATIYRLGRRAYFIEEDLGVSKKVDEFIHTENVVLVDGDGHLRGIYNGLNKTSMKTLVADLRSLGI